MHRFEGMILLMLLVAACGPPAGSATAAVRDSAGVTIVENHGLSMPSLPTWSVGDTPTLAIGALDGPEPYQLYQAMHALRLLDGGVVVANQGTKELRFFGPDGRHVRTVGGEGGGPGEYQGMWSVVRFHGDSLAVWDWSAKRLTVLDDTGAFGRTATPADAGGFGPRMVGAFDDGSFVIVSGFDPAPVFASLGGVRDDSVTLLRFSPAAVLLDSPGVFLGAQEYVQPIEHGFSTRTVPFGREEHLDLNAGRLFVGDDRTGEIRVLDPDGALQRIICLGVEPRVVTDADLERYADRAIAAAGPDDEAATRRRLAGTPHASQLPAFSDMFADRTGRLWLTPFSTGDEPTRTWTVLDPEGLPLATVALPGTFQPLDAGDDFVLGRTTDDLDVERILLFSLSTEGSDR